MRAFAAALLILLAGCASNPPKALPPPPPAEPEPVLDASYDWHVLLTAQFGATLKEVPLKLHEVLLFGDEKNANDGECFGIDGVAPHFMAREPDGYLLCFKQDHLARIEATVSLPLSDAEKIVADTCRLWRRNAAKAGANDSPGDEADCSGSDGPTHYQGHLEREVQEDQLSFTVRLDAPEPL